MSFSQFALLNVTRNKRAYLGYFLSNVLAVMAFFTFMSLSAHPFLATAHPMAVGAMQVSAVFIIFFSFFYIAYSMNAFLQLRKKEFGILMINGLSPKQLRRLIQQENFYIGIVASIVGILFGFALSFVISLIAKVTLDITIPFYFPLKAILITLAVFVILFFVISTYVFYKINRHDLVLFLKQDKMRKEPKASIFLALLSIILILIGYAIAVFSPPVMVILILLPVSVLVTIGTHLFVSQFLVFWANRVRNNKKKFWSKTNMLFYSDLAYRLKDNARSFFFITIITTIVFCALGTLFSLEEMFYRVGDFPYDYTYEISTDSHTQTPEPWQQISTTIQSKDDSFTYQNITSLLLESETQFIDVFSESDYNRFVADGDIPLQLGSNQAAWFYSDALLAYNASMSAYLPSYATDELQDYGLTISNVQNDTVLPGFTRSFLVVNDATFDTLIMQSATPRYIFYAIGDTTTSAKEQTALMKDIMATFSDVGVYGYMQNGSYIVSMINEFYAPVLFIGVFVGIVFFISAGSFLYFRLYGDLAEDKEKFRNIARIGLTRREAQIVVTKQLALLFGVPMVIALCHGTVALNTMAGIFDQTIMISAIAVMGIFTLIQFGYFFVSNSIYLKNVLVFNE